MKSKEHIYLFSPLKISPVAKPRTTRFRIVVQMIILSNFAHISGDKFSCISSDGSGHDRQHDERPYWSQVLLAIV